MKTIDLEIKWDRQDMPISPEEARKIKEYPSFTIERDKPLEIPESGVMSVRYRKTRSSESTSDDGSEHYTCTIQVQAIEDVEEEMEEERSSTNDTADALDKHMEELMAAKKNSKKGKY